MSETKFTPGEWYSHLDGTIRDESCSVIVEGWIRNASPTTAELSNAHLIAAAPEMYEMLENLSCLLTDVNAHQVVNDIESLLAKARGEA